MNAVRNELLNAGIEVSLVRLCRWLGVPRSTVYYEPRERSRPAIDGDMVSTIREASRSIAARPNERWATDLALVFCGERDGWCTFVPVVDCCTRQLLGWELSTTARAKTAERAIEQALIGRFGWTHGAPDGLFIRHDNGLVFGSKLYRRTAREYRLRQEFITPYTPEENGLVERFIRSFKEECVWQSSFASIDEARAAVTKWIDWYNADRPHQAIGYRTPDERNQEFKRAAA